MTDNAKRERVASAIRTKQVEMAIPGASFGYSRELADAAIAAYEYEEPEQPELVTKIADAIIDIWRKQSVDGIAEAKGIIRIIATRNSDHFAAGHYSFAWRLGMSREELQKILDEDKEVNPAQANKRFDGEA